MGPVAVARGARASVAWDGSVGSFVARFISQALLLLRDGARSAQLIAPFESVHGPPHPVWVWGRRGLSWLVAAVSIVRSRDRRGRKLS